MSDDAPLLTIAEAMAVVHVSRRTIYSWLKAGKLTYVRTAGGAVRIVAASLWQVPPAPAPVVP